MAAPVEPTGLPLVDGLTALNPPTIEDYCAASAEYIREATNLGSQKGKAAQIRLSNCLAQVILADLRAKGLGLAGAVAGEREVGGGLRSVKADVSEMSSTDGLTLAVEIKPVHLAVGRAIGRFRRAGRRTTEGEAAHLLEGIAVVAFDRATGAIDSDLPPAGSGLRWTEFIDTIAEVYDARFGEI